MRQIKQIWHANTDTKKKKKKKKKKRQVHVQETFWQLQNNAIFIG